MARWYMVMDRDVMGMIEAPDRVSAEGMALPDHAVVSVCEYEEIQREIADEVRRQERAVAICERALRMDYTLRQATTGQGELMGNTYPPEIEADIKAMAWRQGELIRVLREGVAA